ncbi:SpoIIE family protein phosphatase [Streptomyces violaceusniger]|uniref:protein-serine/threonine phosphatase n=1 Tax=Streptomyces violaceusniger TaxID=68280 RepID=A0A4D4KM95_STRVO|nr:hypothetical protein SVIO_003550 [Streptomyces violaceusniger]
MSGERPYGGRLDLLRAVGDETGGRKALRIALDQAVAGLAGLGGMVHLGGPGSGHLYLAAHSGLSEAQAEAWQSIRCEERVAPALALCGDTAAWSPLPSDAGSGERPRTFSVGTGLTAAPITTPGGPQGALSVLVTTPDGPGARERSLLRAVARWASDRLSRPAVPGGVAAAWAPLSHSRLQRSRTGTGIGAWTWDFATGAMTWDDTALAILSAAPGPYDGRFEAWMSRVHPEDLPGVLAAGERAIRTGSPFGVEYRVRRPDGRYRWVEARGRTLLGEDGAPYRMVGTLQDITGRHAASPSEPVPAPAAEGVLTLDRAGCVSYLSQEAEHLLAPSPPPLGAVLWEAVPELRALGLEAACWQAVADGLPLGFDTRWPTAADSHHIRLDPVPDGLSVHISDATRERDAERALGQRANRLEELAGALAAAATVQAVVDAFADRALPLFGATGLLVQRVKGAYFETVGSRGYTHDFVKLLEAPGHPRTNPLTEALRSAVPLFIASPEEFVERFPELGHLPAASGKNAWAFLPLIVSGEPIGYCSVSFGHPRVLTGEERTLLTALSGLLAQALARARLYDAEHRHAQELQRELLPRSLPALPTVTASARYLPVSESAEVGGDWYDLIPLSGGRVALVIGDVMGHGLSEAATMGRLRTAVRTLADLEMSPDELLSHLNDLVSGLGDDFYATCLYAEYDPTSQICSLARAGHPSPAVVRADGTVAFPELPIAPPLGAATPPFDTCELTLAGDSLLVLYTDGLVEAPGRDIEHGMGDLARNITAALGHTPPGSVVLERLCDTLLAALLPAGQRTNDDAALLIARLRPMSGDDIASWALPDDPQAAGQARDLVRGQLGVWGIDSLTTTTELLVSELVGNVVRHAKGPVGLRLLHSRTLICEVSDGSPATPRIRRAADTDEGGRGLQLVAALAHRWGARYTLEGKCIWTEQLLP